MSATKDTMLDWLQKLMRVKPDQAPLELEQYVTSVPGLESLADLPAGTAVLVRGDVDAKPGKQIGEGDIRLRSMVETLKYGQQKGWVQIVFGHIGRKPDGSLNKVRDRFQELLGGKIPLITDWLDETGDTVQVRDEVVEAIANAPQGSILLLENTRKYNIERVLWEAGPDDLPGLAGPLAAFAGEVLAKIGDVYVHEAFSAGSLDSSSVVLPAGMRRSVLGEYAAGQFRGPLLKCRNAELVVFSGLKADKLDDLQAIVARGKAKMVLTAGSLAMSLKKAAAQLAGTDFCIGVAENPEHKDKPYFVETRRIEQAKQILHEGFQHKIEFVLPVDFLLADGTPASVLTPTSQQLDIGPQTNAFFASKVGDFIAYHEKKLASGQGPGVAFHNGVFGMFEDPKFATGTKEFMSQLQRLKLAGCEVYIGGGEGGTALELYGQPDWVTHVFTAGGTVLNALGAEPIPFLRALYLAQG